MGLSNHRLHWVNHKDTETQRHGEKEGDSFFIEKERIGPQLL
jgi:hypothetical protein